MKNDSEDTKMFSQYYPVQAVPILYFIKQGTIKDFGTEAISEQEIVDKLNALNKVQPSAAPTMPISNTTPAEQSRNPEAAVDTGSMSVERTPATASTSEEQSQTKKIELQKQLEKVRKERMEREQREAKEREIKRRNESKAMQEAQQNRMDKENKVYFDRIKKERQEEEAHRRKVREQIARDRAEKMAKRSAEKQRSPTEEAIDESHVKANSSQSHELSNLSIRQLDGSSIRHQFKATDTLGLVHEWIRQNRTDDINKPYKLSSQFPTRLFTEADDKATLRELDLCPSATVIMKPTKATTSIASSLSSSTGAMSYFFAAYDFVYGLLLMLFNMFTSILTSMFPAHGMRPINAPPQAGLQTSLSQPLRGGQRLGGGESSKTDASSIQVNPSSGQAQKRSNPYKTRINTLQDDDTNEDEDKKRPTYNGNSVNHE
ncbi:UBX domain-containing protein 4 [Choanephora cucurbitarum]|uniref:UBX domain-containing protein 4 n=1 Tax=Choanephora cucurbitarum TaxID=101091 RepID=A0A1C7NKE5_9FUNG|nr:UBX domain-containing protein 4 [Choanephora cucurbitarum]